MILLDSDHLTVLRFGGDRSAGLRSRLFAANDPRVGTTVVNVEESMRGWMASIAKERQPLRQVSPYRELAELFEFFAGQEIALFDEAAARQLAAYTAIRIGLMDRKVAAIAVTQDALLLTANRRDFERIPGLRFENWLTP